MKKVADEISAELVPANWSYVPTADIRLDDCNAG
jgi:hypothetical protein